ncbi:MAG: tetratricopeptide repeat protein [Bacteroidales bacterium]|nr:tetratricopeptide repeat protein [Bacteroidales bacterium]
MLRYKIILMSLVVILITACQSHEQKKEVLVEADPKPATEIENLNIKISKDSLNPDLYYQRSKYYTGQQDINLALSDINRAIELDDRKSAYYVALSDIYLAMGRIPGCLEALKRAEELDPNNNEALLKLAEVYLILKEFQNTFEYTKRALDMDRINPVAHFIRGYAYMELGDTALAIRNFQVAADQDQHYYNAYVELGILYMIQKNPLATGYLQTATAIEPNRKDAYYLLGLAYQEQENISKAVETYEKVLVIAPDFKEAHYNLGYLNLVYINDFDAAIHYFNRAIALDQSYVDAYFNRGYSYELMGNFENARKDYRKALSIHPNYENSIIGLNRIDSLEGF